MKTILRKATYGSFIALILLLASESKSQSLYFRITLTNLTNTGINSGQHFSPSIFSTHKNNFSFWNPGDAASFGLQQIAEEGDNTAFLADLALAGSDVGTTYTFGGPTLPGQSVSFDLTTTANHSLLSSVWMLGRTNDGFAGLRSFNLLSVGNTPVVLDLFALDAGTEVNNELAAFLPALGGIGLNDPELGVVGPHAGLRGSLDPLSNVPDSWKWTGPVARVSITTLAPEPGTLALCFLAPAVLVLRRKRNLSVTL